MQFQKLFSEYGWEYNLSQKEQYVLSGYFAFSSKKFQNMLKNTEYDFVGMSNMLTHRG